MSVVNCVLRFAAFSSIFAREACKDIFRVLKWYTKTLNSVFLSPFKNETKVKLKTHAERESERARRRQFLLRVKKTLVKPVRRWCTRERVLLFVV